MSSLNEKPLYVNVKLAMKIGLNEAIIYNYISQKTLKNRYFLDLTDMHSDCSFLSKITIKRSLKKLIEIGKIKEIILTSEEKRGMLYEKQLTGMGIGNKTCEWCGYKSSVLHEHHYPIPKIEKGTEIVNICANCHYEYHHIRNELIISEVL